MLVAAVHQNGMEAATEVSTDAADGEEFEFQAAFGRMILGMMLHVALPGAGLYTISLASGP